MNNILRFKIIIDLNTGCCITCPDILIKGKKKYWASRNLNLPMESTFVLDNLEVQSLHNELTEDNCLYYKSCMYQVGTVPHNVRYYEHKVEVDDHVEREST